MRIWAISDLHFPGERNKQMDQFGPVWREHISRLVENWRRMVGNQDIVLVAGDITWAGNKDGVMNDLHRIADLPGEYKIIVQGNHDFWWKKYKVIHDQLPKSIVTLKGHAIKLKNHIFCGSRGWLAPNDPCFDNLDHKTYQKELVRMKRALEEATAMRADEPIHTMMHFPPFTTHGAVTPFVSLITKYPVSNCVYGHFHFKSEWDVIPKGVIDGVAFHLTATDYLEHQPQLIWDEKPVKK